MAGKNGITKARRIAATRAAEKNGEAWARLFIERVRERPTAYELQGYAQDAESLFRNDKDELRAFYATLQAVITGAKTKGTPIALAIPEYNGISAALERAKDLAGIIREGAANDDSRAITLTSLLEEQIEQVDLALRKADDARVRSAAPG